MAICSQTNIPEIDTEADPCNGERISTGCITTPVALPDLNISIDDTQTDINQAIYNALIALSARVDALE